MEFNVRNCLGPSHEDIPTTLMLQHAWYDDNVYVVDDADFGYTPPNYDGPMVVYNAPSDEVEWVERRITQLEDLMDLRNPLPWAEVMYTRNCPCGMDNATWEKYVDYCNGRT